MKSSPEISLENEILVNEMSKRRSKTMMMLALCINILGLAFIFGSVTQFNRGLIKVQEDYSRVQALHGKVLRIDEILTMSCWVASTTSDQRWRDRYQRYVPVLDETLSKLIERTPKKAHVFIQETTAANDILVKYEERALKASQEGDQQRALSFLTSVEYSEQKERYSKGMESLDLALRTYFENLLDLEYQQIKRREVIIVVIIFGLAFFWIVIYQTASRWQSATRRHLELSSQLKKSLKERLASHQQLAEEQAIEVENLRLALLRAEQQERKRLGQSVHDDLQQVIVALRLKSSMYRDRASVEDERNAYQELVLLADEALSSARDLVMRLSPPGEHKNSLLEMIAMMTAQFLQRYDLTVHVKSAHFKEPPQVETRQLLFRAIRELLFNIVKYAQVTHAEVTLKTESDSDHVIVSDQGVGFNPDKITEQRGIRTGLGLSGMREQFEMVGGEVEITSAIDVGTMITLKIPHLSSYENLTQRDQELQPSTSTSQQSLVSPAEVLSQIYRVFIVDDNHALRKMLIQLFQSDPHFIVVGEAASGPEAVEIVDSHELDLLLIDYSLPGFDGAEAAQKILDKRPAIKVVGFTSFELPEVLERFKQAGTNQVLLKGSDPQDLINSCLQALHS